MCKKLGVAALALVAAVFVLGKLDLLWHVKDHVRKARAEIRNQIPTEDKLARLKSELGNLRPEKTRHLNVIAEEVVRIEKLEQEIGKTKANLVTWGENIKALKDALKNENAVFVTLGTEKLAREKVEASLARRWEAFKDAEESLKSQEELLSRRREKLEVAQTKLRTMEAKEKEMRAKVEKLEIELAKLREAQMVNDVTIDDSEFSRVLKLFNEIEEQVAKEKKVLELQKGVDTDKRIEEVLNEKSRVERAIKEVEERFNEDKVAAGRK